MNKKSLVLSGALIFSLTASLGIMAASPIDELRTFENKLITILTDLHNQNGAKVTASQELIQSLQNEWDTMIQQHTGKRIRYGKEMVPVNQDASYKDLKSKVQRKLTTTINVLKSRLAQ